MTRNTKKTGWQKIAGMTSWLTTSLWVVGSVACSAPVAVCDADEDCPGKLVCDAPTGVCALPAQARDEDGVPRRQALNDEEGAPVAPDGDGDAQPSTPGDDGGDAPPAEDPPADAPVGEEPPAPPPDTGDDDSGDDDSGDCPSGDGDNNADDGDGGGEDVGDGQCIEEGDACAFNPGDDGCCASFHCCPVFEVCVPNFWE